MLKVKDTIQIKIDKMANEGKGLGKHNNQVIFVPFSVPGDTLKVEITKVTKNYSEADILEVITPSKDRIIPPCKYYKDCGGCNFQHIRYQKQLEIKTFLVKETLEKFLKIESIAFNDTIPSAKEFHYRNRIQLHKEDHLLGFHKRKTHQILPIESCMIAEEPLNDEFRNLKNLPQNPKSKKLELFLAPDLSVKHRWLDQDSAPSLFAQVNRFQNENLIQFVTNYGLNFPNIKSVFDLYGGSGNFSFPLSKALPNTQFYVVELSPSLILQGKKLAEQSKTLSIKFVESPVEYFLRNFSISTEDLIILDPPRIGCQPEVMQILASEKRQHLVYISCNHITLARDLALLNKSAQNWGLSLKINSIQCLDMFPQTDHIEVMSVLSIL